MDWLKSSKPADVLPSVEELPKPKAEVFNPPTIKCACGNPVEKESPQIDQCLACFNRK